MSLDHLTWDQLEAGLDEIRSSPRDTGILRLIVRRPRIGEREVLQTGQLDLVEALVGDNWKVRGSPSTHDGSAHPDMQLTIMNARAIALIASEKARWPLAGDQLYIDMDISADNLPPGSQLSVGSALIQVTDHPHNGCKNFSARFGVDALKFVNSPVGKQLHLRGINAKVVRSGAIQVGDQVRKIKNA